MTPQPDLDVVRIATGLWRWTAPHPEWTPDKDRPGGWGRMVGCVYYEPVATAGAPIVLIDPLAPPAGSAEGERFAAALDLDLKAARRPVVIFLGNSYHLRDAIVLRERLGSPPGCEAFAHPETLARLDRPGMVPFGPASSRSGVEVIPIESLGAGETAFFIPEHRALVFADAVIGAGQGRLAVAPASWADKGEAAATRYRESFRSDLTRLLRLDPAMVLTSHGQPALADGKRALQSALQSPAWGE